MPRYRRRTSMPRQPRAPKPVLPPKPKGNDLRHILKGYISPDSTQRLNALAYALQWYDNALQYCLLKQTVTPDLQRTLNRAVLARKQGQGTNILHEKDTSYRTAVTLYEKVCAAVHPPSASTYFKQYDLKKDVLEKKQSSLGEKYGELVNILTDALQAKNPEGQVLKIIITDAAKPFGFDPTITQVSYDKAEARRIKDKIRREGLLPVAIEEAARLSRGAAYELAPDGSGKYIVNTKKMIESYHSIMQNFARYAVTPNAPKRLAKPFAAPQATGQPSTSSAPRQKVVRTMGAKGPKVLNMYLAGGAMAVLAQHLADHNTQFIEQADLQKLVTAEVTGRLKAMMKHGVQYGMWSVEQQGTKWRMVLNTAAANQQPSSGAAATP